MPSFVGMWVLLLIALWSQASWAMVSSLDGKGNFPAKYDVINRWQADGTLDILVIAEIPNADLTYQEEGRGLVGRFRMEVALQPLEGEPIIIKRNMRTAALAKSEASSRTLNQVFGIVLHDVQAREGKLRLHVYDAKSYQEGIWNQYKRRLRRSEASTYWYAENSANTDEGIALGDPLFLFLAPLTLWEPSVQAHHTSDGGRLHDYMHPSRRYGIEQDKLQAFIPVWPPKNGIRSENAEQLIAVQVTNMEMDFALNDTISMDQLGRRALHSGRAAGLFYELDINLLPAGAYRLTFAPLSGQGRAISSGFDVVWRLDRLGRHHQLQMAEGSIIFQGRELTQFRAASHSEKEVMLDRFWEEHNPDPENPVNTAFLEFQSRMAYVHQFLGGFDETGPVDDRGLVMVMLGPPDEMQREAMPMNSNEQDDAQIKVFERFAPDRESVWSKGSDPSPADSNDPYKTSSGIPMPYSQRAAGQIQGRSNSAAHNFSFELWKYDRNGRPLFDNQFSQSTMGARFLFLDRTGSGDYFLESSNTVQGEE
ncbi:MAG: GWxTD domain-containing protein [bacterium]|nr:GWxTD domain-containing protein [bacterium]